MRISDWSSDVCSSDLAEGYHAFLIGEEKRFTVAASDPDSEDRLVFTAEGLPEGATVDPDSGEFAWTPGPGNLAGDGRGGCGHARSRRLHRAALRQPKSVRRLLPLPDWGEDTKAWQLRSAEHTSELQSLIRN